MWFFLQFCDPFSSPSLLSLLPSSFCTQPGALCIQGGLDPSVAGLALMYALDLTRYLKQATNMASQSESNFNSVERIAQVGVGQGVGAGIGVL